MAIDVNMINASILEIAIRFAAFDDTGWYGSSYLLTLTVFQPSLSTRHQFFNVDMTYIIRVMVLKG
jgi:hypothetical protein